MTTISAGFSNWLDDLRADAKAGDNPSTAVGEVAAAAEPTAAPSITAHTWRFCLALIAQLGAASGCDQDEVRSMTRQLADEPALLPSYINLARSYACPLADTFTAWRLLHPDHYPMRIMAGEWQLIGLIPKAGNDGGSLYDGAVMTVAPCPPTCR